MVLLISRSSLQYLLVEGQTASQNQPRQLGNIEWHNHKLSRAKRNYRIQVLNNSLSFSEIKLRQEELEVWLVYNVSLKSWMTIGQEHFPKLNLAKLVEISKQEFQTIMCQFYSVHSMSIEMVFSALMNSFLQSEESLTKEDFRRFKKLSKLLTKMARVSSTSTISKTLTMQQSIQM